MKLLSFSGFIPEQIVDTKRFISFPGDRTIQHYCGYASDFISQVKSDVEISGAVFPKTCDSSRIIKSYLEGTDKFLFQFSVPSIIDDNSIEFYAKEIRRYKNAVEDYFKCSISNDDIIARTIMINERNLKILDAYERINELSYSEYLSLIHSCMADSTLSFSKDSITNTLDTNVKKIFLIGSFLSNVEIAGMIERLGMKIVGDNLPESGRICSNPKTELEGDIFKNISSNILMRKQSPSQNSFKELIEKDIDEIKKKKADAAIMVIQKYCEPYEYLYSIYKSKLEMEGIPLLKINLLNSQDIEKVELQLDAFSGTL